MSINGAEVNSSITSLLIGSSSSNTLPCSLEMWPVGSANNCSVIHTIVGGGGVNPEGLDLLSSPSSTKT